MYRYGRKSKEERATLYPRLQNILDKTLIRHDHSINNGGRTEDEQWAVFNNGTSTLHPPNGKHLLRPDPSKKDSRLHRFMPLVMRKKVKLYSFAADVCPYINGRRLATDRENFGPNQKAQFAYFLGILKEVADQELEGTGWEIRLGINWDMDAEILTDQSFQDWFHCELVWRGR